MLTCEGIYSWWRALKRKYCHTLVNSIWQSSEGNGYKEALEYVTEYVLYTQVQVVHVQMITGMCHITVYAHLCECVVCACDFFNITLYLVTVWIFSSYLCVYVLLYFLHMEHHTEAYFTFSFVVE